MLLENRNSSGDRIAQIDPDSSDRVSRLAKMPGSRGFFKNGGAPDTASVSSTLDESVTDISNAVATLKLTKTDTQQWNKLAQTIQVLKLTNYICTITSTFTSVISKIARNNLLGHGTRFVSNKLRVFLHK